MDELKIEAKLENYEQAAAFIEEGMVKAGADSKVLFKVLTACEEIIVNIMKYAYPEGKGDLTISLLPGDGSVTIVFADSGIPFDPFARTGPDTSLPLEEREIGGLGILMVKNIMDETGYEFREGRNIVTVRKILG